MKTKLDLILSLIGFCGLLFTASIDSESFAPYFITFIVSAFFLIAGRAIKLPFLPYED